MAPRAHAPHVAALLVLLFATPAPAEEIIQRTRLWPATLAFSVLIGGEPQGERGTPLAFGAGIEAMWKGRVGGFAQILSSEGTPIVAHGRPDGTTDPSLADRISIPFGLTARPFTPIKMNSGWLRQFVAGIGVQAGITVEHVRTSDDSATNVGLHLGASLELPLWGGPLQGGVSLRLQGRLMVTSDATLEQKSAQKVYEPIASGQIYGGLCYYPNL